MTSGLEGMTLKARLARETGGLDADVALKVADGLLAELAAAQTAGGTHRELTSDVVFLCSDGSVKLVDFEISQQAPRQSQTADEVLAAGVVIHEALTGCSPFADKNLRIKSSVRRVLAHADEVLQKALSEDPSGRYPDASAFRAALRQIRYREVRSSTDAYRLLRVVGEGGFGCVYRAWARGAGRFVAVKQLKRPEYGDRFRREAHVMRKLDDPAFVRLVDYFETKDLGARGAFLVMDFLPGMPGSSLRDAIRRAAGVPLPYSDVILAFERYARALAIMHRLKIYHRDIKPSNLYFPQGDPLQAAIMDLGIARDVSGTATQGQVPGTLDYMPPEVVLGGSRGDAGMDIYALGLCLYEALTGQTAYPRLPTGPQAFSSFYERARAHVVPVFDAPCIRERPLLLALLQEMTALDPNERLQDAELLRRRLMTIAAKDVGAASDVRLPPGDAAVDASVVVASADAATGETSGGGARQPLSLRRYALPFAVGRRVKIAGGAVAALLVLLALWRPLLRTIASVRFRPNAVNVPIAEDQAARGDDRERQDAEAVQAAAREQQALLNDIAGANATADDCALRISAWRDKWRGAIDPASYVSLERALADAIFERKNRDADADRRTREAQRVWQQRQEASLRAVEAARPVEAAYADRTQALDVADRAYAAWRLDWQKVLDLPTVSNAANRIIAVRRQRVGWEEGSRVVAECNRYLDNVSLVGAEDVRNWTGLVRQAELALMKAESVGSVTPAQAAALRARISACGHWVVGVIDNKTDRALDFAGKTIGPVSSVTVAFTNGYPAGAAIRCPGCEPIHVREERFSARVYTVMPRDLDERACETKAIIPSYPSGMTCHIDGIARKPGEVLLRRGPHVVRYSRTAETYPGVLDYEPKEYAFETRLSESVDVPGPTGEWSRSAAFDQAKDEAQRVARGKGLVAECRRLLEPLPVETRRKRLEEAHARLSDWQTSSLLAIVGAGVEKSLRADYEAERMRVRGYVRNATALAASVTTDGAPVAVAPGEKRLVTFERRWPSDARVVIPGYEFVMLPQEAAAFDGRTFEVTSNKLVKIGAWEDPKEREKRSFLDSFRDAVDAERRLEIENLKRAIELRKKLDGETEEIGR